MGGFDRAASGLRWGILALACVGMLGSYFSYDIPSALNDQMLADLNINEFQLNLLYSVYSFPNIILPLFGGFFVDKLGSVLCCCIFSGLILAGQGVFALGCSIKSFGLALFGRVLFGFGGESLSVASSALLAVWFKGKEMAFAMGLNLSISRLGSVVNDYVSPAIYNARNVATACWFGFIVCAASFVACIGMTIVEKMAARRAAEGQPETPLLAGDAPKEDEEIRISDIRFFGKPFWLLTVGCVVVYGTILPFNIIAGSFLQANYGYSLTTADSIMSIPFFISAALCPFLGGAVDKFGHRVHFQLLSAVSIVLVHLYFCFTYWTPFPPLVVLGLAYSVYAAAIWPSVPYLVADKSVGTAYGVITAVQNGGLAAIPLISGDIHDRTGSYHYTEFFFWCLGVVGIAIGLWLLFSDLATGGLLCMPTAEATAAKAALAKAGAFSGGANINPNSIAVLVAAGTGTPLTDPNATSSLDAPGMATAVTVAPTKVINPTGDTATQ